MEKKISKEHKKHANLTKPNIGSFSRNEWAIIGAPCNIIRSLVDNVQVNLNAIGSCVFIDETHNHEATANSPSQVMKMQDGFEMKMSREWNRNEYHALLNNYSFCLVNGNHFKAKKQLVYLHPSKKESLFRKLDRLSDVRAFISTSENKQPYEFLKEHIPNWQDIPILNEKEQNGISDFIKSDFDVPGLKALVLAGGRSVRMGHDKGKIQYHNTEQRSHMYDMLKALVPETFMSCREDQKEELKDFDQIVDRLTGMGPFGAIVSAFATDPNSSWVVVPCDLPFLESKHIENLIQNRNPHKLATTYHNRETAFPEPLISIWEPRMYQQLLQFLSQGFSCPRKVLINSDVHQIHAINQDFMKNVNTPEDYKEVEALLKD